MVASTDMRKVFVVFLILNIRIDFSISIETFTNENSSWIKPQLKQSIDKPYPVLQLQQQQSNFHSPIDDSNTFHSVNQYYESPNQQQQQVQYSHQQTKQQSHLPNHLSSSEQFDLDYNISNDKEIANNPLNRGPYFDVSASRNVTALVGKTAYLNCRIKNLGNKTVTWIRHRDLHLLTVDKNTYTSDQRFISVHNPQMGDWSLKVIYPQKRDSGVYECQVSTTPPVGYSMILSVVEPITTIQGGSDLYIDTGSTVNLTCVVRHLPEPPPSILWTHNNQEINYDSPRGGVSVITEKGDITTSYLLIQRARIADSGKYTCSPSHANPQSVNVHVLNGEEPAAIQHGHNLQINCPIVVLMAVLMVMMNFICYR